MVTSKMFKVLFILIAVAGLTDFHYGQTDRPVDLRSQLQVVESIALPTVYQARFTDNGQPFVSSRNRGGSWFFQKGETRGRFEPCNGVPYRGGDLDHTGSKLMISCPGLIIEMWDLGGGEKVAHFQSELSGRDRAKELIYFQSLSRNGTRAAFSLRDLDDRAELWDAVGQRKIATLTSELTACHCNRSVYAIEFSPDGGVVAVAFGGMVFLWDAATGKLLHRLIDESIGGGRAFTHNGLVRNILFTADGKMVITGGGEGKAKSWNVETGELINTFQKHKLGITALALSPDQKILATGSRNQDVKLWDMATGKQLLTLNNRKEVREISFHPNGQRLMSMTSTHMFIWETNKGTKLAEMPITDLGRTALSPDWTRVMMRNKVKNTLEILEYQGH